MIYPWQSGVWRTIQQALRDDHLHHALLFSGEDGCGNEVFVQVLAQSLLCLKPGDEGRACGQCRSCQVFGAQAHPDFSHVVLQEDKQSILIEQIRELNYFLGLSRSYSPRRAVIIHPAERMNVNAANSLLKSLEEPAPSTHILLLSAHPEALPPTIRSRCQNMRLPLPERDEALAWLQARKPQNSAEILLEAASGRPLQALELDTTDTLQKREQWLQDIFQALNNDGHWVDTSSRWEKYDKTALLDWQMEWVIALSKGNEVFASPSVVLKQSLHPARLQEIYAGLLELKKLATHPVNPRLFVESMLMLWAESIS